MPAGTNQEKPASAIPTPARLLAVYRREFAGFRGALAGIAVVAAVSAVTEVLLAFLIAALGATMLDYGGSGIGVLDRMSGRQLAGLSVAALVLRAGFDLLRLHLEARALARYESACRKDLVHAFLWAEWPVQAKQDPGRVVSSMFAFVGSGRGALQQLAQISTLAVSFAVVLAGSLYAGGAWVLAILAGTGVLALLFRPLSHAAHSAGDRTRMATRGFSTALNQLLSTSLEIRIFGVEQRAAESADELADELGASNARQNLVKGRLNSLYSSAVYLLAVGGLGALTIAEVSDPARYAAVVLLLFRGMGYGRGLQSAYQNLLSLLPGIEDLEESRRELHGARVREGGRAIPAGFHSLRLDDVSFSYTADAPALESVSLELVAGQAVGLVGPSGSGKSTLVSLLLGLRSPSSGRVLVDGHDLAEADMRSWYGRAVLVPQEPHILQETIAENVRCYREDVTDDQIERALRQAHAYEEFLALPNGIDTEIGEYGVRLSGGQRQRLALARALAGQPELLILDEPTSALDALSEEAIRVSLEEIRGSVTLVVIAHRLSTLRICDSIVVMEKGRLSGIGSRESIERDSEFFAEAVRLARTV